MMPFDIYITSWYLYPIPVTSLDCRDLFQRHIAHVSAETFLGFCVTSQKRLYTMRESHQSRFEYNTWPQPVYLSHPPPVLSLHAEVDDVCKYAIGINLVKTSLRLISGEQLEKKTWRSRDNCSRDENQLCLSWSHPKVDKKWKKSPKFLRTRRLWYTCPLNSTRLSLFTTAFLMKTIQNLLKNFQRIG